MIMHCRATHNNRWRHTHTHTHTPVHHYQNGIKNYCDDSLIIAFSRPCQVSWSEMD